MSRQVPRLPHATAGGKKQSKENTSGIDGWIMDPIAWRTAQCAAKALHAREAGAAQPAPVRLDTQPAAADANTPQVVHISVYYRFAYFSLSFVDLWSRWRQWSHNSHWYTQITKSNFEISTISNNSATIQVIFNAWTSCKHLKHLCQCKEAEEH